MALGIQGSGSASHIKVVAYETSEMPKTDGTPLEMRTREGWGGQLFFRSTGEAELFDTVKQAGRPSLFTSGNAADVQAWQNAKSTFDPNPVPAKKPYRFGENRSQADQLRQLDGK
jgi:hypothetical protein